VHCAECEFRDRCRQKAIETDDLSLLSGITEAERTRYRSKGIFTVTQLSYTFRPRRAPKRAKNPGRLRYPALQALAIRENSVYIHGTVRLPDSASQVYLDIEGLPDTDSYYLISALVFFCEGQETFHTFWAEQESDAPTMFAQFADAISILPDFRVLHFGEYETVALKKVKARAPESLHPKIDMILDRATNVLSAIYPHVYFPTYSNGLKEIGKFLGFERAAEEDATGLHSIMWRKSWDDNHDPEIKARLVQYNQDDCRELRHIADFIQGLTAPGSGSAVGPLTRFKTARTEDLARIAHAGSCLGPRNTLPKTSSRLLSAPISITNVKKCLCCILISRQLTRGTEGSNGPYFQSTKRTQLIASAVPNAEAGTYTKASR
jgi:predicted RecB family nuclease